MLQSDEVNEIVWETGGNHPAMNPEMGVHLCMTGLKYPFGYSKGSFYKGACYADCGDSAFVFGWD